MFRQSTFGDMCMGELGGVCKVDIKEISTSNHLEVKNETILIYHLLLQKDFNGRYQKHPYGNFLEITKINGGFFHR